MKEMGPEEFIRILKMHMTDYDGKFILFLGAGCSVSSGIPAAGALVKNWLPRLKKIKTGDEGNIEQWIREKFPEYDEKNPGMLYGKIIEELFFTPEVRQREIERIIGGKDPGFGYAVLAQLISHADYGTQCNVILTTNFDDLVADALYLYTNKKPLVISHESLISFVRVTRTNPVIIKLHGDARLAPKNTELETQELTEAVKKVMTNLLSEAGIIFVGYGGNDHSILNILKELPLESLRWGIYWVRNSLPENDMRAWLETRKANWVKHLDFDELMLLMRSELELEHPDMKRFEKLTNTYLDTFKSLTTELEAKPDSPEKMVVKRAIKKPEEDFKTWWSVVFEANKYEKNDIEKANNIYLKGLDKFPDKADLLGAYAIFLKNIRKDYDKAEEYYLKALEADPNHANNLSNYAFFLQKIRKGYDKAEEYYLKALEADPNHANSFGIYALFLKNIRKDYDKAKEYYLKSLEVEPNNADFLGNYVGFLLSRGNFEKGIDLLSRAIQLSDTPALFIECLFYQYAHNIDDEVKNDSLVKMKELIASGSRSPEFNLEDNVQRAIADGHPHPQFLEALAKVISEELDPSSLDQFREWTEPK
jgi:Tfp pilus assembly protein PilF